MKRALVVLSVVLLILAAGAVALSIWAKGPALELKERLLSRVEEKIGREVSVGDFGGNPFTGFYVRDVVVAGRTHGESPTLKLEKLKFRISLFRLFKGQVKFRCISLVRPVVYYHRAVNGDTNLDDILERLSELKEAEDREDDKKKRKEGEKQEIETAPVLMIDRVVVKSGTLQLSLEREGDEPFEAAVEPVDVSLRPVGPGGFDEIDVRAKARVEKLKISGNGILRPNKTDAVDFEWETNKLAINELSEIVPEIEDHIKNFDVAGELFATGMVAGSFKEPKFNAGIGIENASVKTIKLGDGHVDVRNKDRAMFVDGEISSKEGKTTAIGVFHLDTGEWSAALEMKGFNAVLLSKKLFPDLPDIVSGSADVLFRANSGFFNKDKSMFQVDVDVDNGELKYPTPSISGELSGWAALPFDKITATAKINHNKSRIYISNSALSSSDLSFIVWDSVIYRNRSKPGMTYPPFNFDMSAKLNCSNIRAVLEKNPHLGPFLSGKIDGKAQLSGATNDMETLKGNVNFKLTDGRIVNPYAEEAKRLPINSNLSHFEFDSLAGKLDVADQYVNIKTIALQSGMINADLSGAVGFDGALRGHAKTTLKPSLLETIADFEEVIPRLKYVKNLKRIETSFDFSGSIQEPHVKWNADDLLRNEAKRLMEEKGDRLLEKVKEKAREEFDVDDVDEIKDKLKEKKDKLKEKLKKLF